MTGPANVVSFWLEAGPQKWFAKDDGFDLAIRDGFLDTHFAAARGDLADWQQTAEGSLALLILLDQFPRNLFRGSGHAFATDPLARMIARKALERGFDRAVAPELRPFLYLPFEHSEDQADQALSMQLFTAHRDETGDTESLRWAVEHRDIIANFGRFPHRNAALGRETTSAEQAYLDGGGFKG
ncbi:MULTISPECIES: DUF924 family protein [Alphaproteobacteria]|uniref:DUF924 domain-containing protein n=2 Tax=Alphaproteobacteria TaxID=28211 RepID=A0A512HLN3_9HYPH|nr:MULTISPECIES: DUF924 family protein [Alphaproteobacteria]GEO86357.1 hypothetical protein RNA01_32890 [Ciceribacter naphthalenivorans]GLR21839.1 hypothetical protein GCM10007920_16260 [Ciceribacter naphthalenivorans]GLT04695.1 hypothetical protein GCM10007926_16260 [Sphingomonas psychrolutea]